MEAVVSATRCVPASRASKGASSSVNGRRTSLAVLNTGWLPEAWVAAFIAMEEGSTDQSAQSSADSFQRLDDLGGPLRHLIIAKRALGRLEFCPHKQ